MSIRAYLQRAIDLAWRRARAGHVVLLVLPVSEDAESAAEEETKQLDKEWKRDFLEGLRRGRTVKAAAELSGVTRRHARRCYHKDLKFAEAWDEIKRSR